MNSDTVVQLLQKGFRITLGATSTLLETVQDPRKRDETIAQLSQEWNKLSEEWAARGEATEQEARQFVENLIHNRTTSAPANPTANTTGEPNSAAPAPAEPDVQSELQDLTSQVAAMREEIEKLRDPEA